MKADGILGLAPTNEGTTADLIHSKFQTSGVIQNRTFSMSIGSVTQVSKMTIGGFDINKFGQPNSTMRWHNLTSSRYWSISMTKANIGTIDIPITVNQMIIDSGTSYLLMPTGNFDIN